MNTKNDGCVAVLGAGGHAKVVISTLQEMGMQVSAIYDDDPEKWGKSLLGVRVVGSTADLPDLPSVRAIVGIGDSVDRRTLALKYANVTWVTAVHPRSYVHSTVSLGAGTVVCAGAVIQPDTVIGAHVIVNTGATIDHDCRVHDYAHVGPGVHVAGGVEIGRNVLLGIGSCVTPGVTIGDGTIVGSGGTVIHSLPDNVVAVGIPAKPIKHAMSRSTVGFTRKE